MTQADKWILSKVNTPGQQMLLRMMEKFELGIAVQKIYDFIWEEFCDWYIEMVKPRLYNDEDHNQGMQHCGHLKTVLIRRFETAAPIYAVYHRGNLLYTDG